VSEAKQRSGPLVGVRVVEVAGIGPGPFAAMVLADLGADVVRVDRASDVGPGDPPLQTRVLGRGRRSVAVDLKRPAGLELLLGLVERADVLLEGFRPGVAERLGFGPDICHERNPRLVYGRITGWGQSGPWAGMAGHDINYIALSGALGAIGRKGEAPVAPLNLIGDFGGGGMLLALGVACALVERQGSGRGQVVDAAMLEGSNLLMSMVYEMLALGDWTAQRGENVLDTGAHFYDVYETADGRWISFGAIEPKFYREFLQALGLGGEELPDQFDRAAWPGLKQRVAERVREHTRDEWEARLAGSDACFAPVLHPSEAPDHPQNLARENFIELDGMRVPAPAPRFSRTPGRVSRPAPRPGAHNDEVLREWGFDLSEIERYRSEGALRD